MLSKRSRGSEATNLSSTVNEALSVIPDRLERHEALGELLDELDAKFGEPSDELKPWAKAAIDELDGVCADFDLGLLVGAVLDASTSSSIDIVDAHLVAVCIRAGGGLVITSDPTDIQRLAAPFTGLRIMTRSP